MNYSVGAVIVNYNNYWDTIDCVSNHLLPQQGINLKIAVVDNASTNNSACILENTFEGVKNVRVITTSKNRGYAAGNNIGIKHLIKNHGCSYIAIANNDIELNDVWLINKLVKKYRGLNKAAFVAPVMLEKNKISKNSAWKLPTITSEVLSSTFCLTIMFSHFLNGFSYELGKRESSDVPVDCVSGSFFIGSSETFEKIGCFDEGTFLYYEENILGNKVKHAHLNNYIVKDLAYNHRWSKSINSEYSTSEKYSLRFESKLYYWKKYRKKGVIFATLLRVLHYCNIIEIEILGFCRKLSGFVVNTFFIDKRKLDTRKSNLCSIHRQ
jgi:GT2 family glycosyltransferase